MMEKDIKVPHVRQIVSENVKDFMSVVIREMAVNVDFVQFCSNHRKNAKYVLNFNTTKSILSFIVVVFGIVPRLIFFILYQNKVLFDRNIR